ncbi:MAG TPA: hypothetical protein VJN44_01945 [Roseateles sp.]|nr:hypothetical protein [Roseateles sp.]
MELTLREIPHFPPPWSFAPPGRPEERRSRLAARRALVELKLSFTRAAVSVPGELGLALQTQVRQACEPLELWLLRGPLLEALPEEAAAAQAGELSRALARSLEGVAAQRPPR